MTKSLELRWKLSFSASCLHLATAMAEGLPIADSAIASRLLAPTEALLSELQAAGLDAPQILPTMISLAADFENNRQLIEMTVRRTRGAGAVSEASLGLLAGCISDLEAAWLREQPNLVEELAVRGRPLREQWEARGPGLLRAVAMLGGEQLLAPAAEIVLVSPAVGGHGRAELHSNRVTFEAVLTNPHPELPEILRLGWLLSQLNLDVPVLSEPLPTDRVTSLASWATLPIVLAAAEQVELASLDEPTLAAAISAWYLPQTQCDNVVEKLLEWWQAFSTSQTRWPVALAALEQMLLD